MQDQAQPQFLRGIYTTEFWLSTAAALVSAAYASGVIGQGTPLDKALSVAAMALAAAGYSVSRGQAKAGQQ